MLKVARKPDLERNLVGFWAPVSLADWPVWGGVRFARTRYGFIRIGLVMDPIRLRQSSGLARRI